MVYNPKLENMAYSMKNTKFSLFVRKFPLYIFLRISIQLFILVKSNMNLQVRTLTTSSSCTSYIDIVRLLWPLADFHG